MVHDIAGCEHVGNAGGGGIAAAAGLHADVAAVHFQLAFEHRRIRRVADRDEHTLERDVARAAIFLIPDAHAGHARRSEEHTSELQSLMRISYAVFCLKKKTINKT